MDLTLAGWLLAAAIVLHMLEEVIWLPPWSQTAGAWHPPVGRGEFGLSAAVVVLLAVLLAWASQAGGRESLGAYLLAAFSAVMFLNFFVPHAGAALQLRRYAPGLLTSAALVVPASLNFVQQAMAQGYVSALPFLLAAAGATVLVAVVWPRLVGLARRVLRQAR